MPKVWVPIIRSWALTRGFSLHPGTRNRYAIRYTRTQHRPASRQVNDHGRVSGTHRSAKPLVMRLHPSRSFERPERTAKRANNNPKPPDSHNRSPTSGGHITRTHNRVPLRCSKMRSCALPSE